MLAFDVLVRGRLTERVDGLPVVVPRGHCQVQTHEGVASLLWTDDDGTPCSIALSATRLEQYLDAGAIVIMDAAQICNASSVRTA